MGRAHRDGDLHIHDLEWREVTEGGLVDWVGFDVKAAPDTYDRVTGVRNSAAPALRSLRLLRESGVAHQLRTTVGPGLLDRDGVAEPGEWLAGQGLSGHVWQRARPV